jgi:hypothetical protein
MFSREDLQLFGVDWLGYTIPRPETFVTFLSLAMWILRIQVKHAMTIFQSLKTFYDSLVSHLQFKQQH